MLQRAGFPARGAEEGWKLCWPVVVVVRYQRGGPPAPSGQWADTKEQGRGGTSGGHQPRARQVPGWGGTLSHRPVTLLWRRVGRSPALALLPSEDRGVPQPHCQRVSLRAGEGRGPPPSSVCGQETVPVAALGTGMAVEGGGCLPPCWRVAASSCSRRSPGGFNTVKKLNFFVYFIAVSTGFNFLQNKGSEATCSGGVSSAASVCLAPLREPGPLRCGLLAANQPALALPAPAPAAARLPGGTLPPTALSGPAGPVPGAGPWRGLSPSCSPALLRLHKGNSGASVGGCGRARALLGSCSGSPCPRQRLWVEVTFHKAPLLGLGEGVAAQEPWGDLAFPCPLRHAGAPSFARGWSRGRGQGVPGSAGWGAAGVWCWRKPKEHQHLRQDLQPQRLTRKAAAQQDRCRVWALMRFRGGD